MNRSSAALRALHTTDDKVAAFEKFTRRCPNPTAEAWAVHLRCDAADARRLLKTLVAVGWVSVAPSGHAALTIAGARTVARVNKIPVVSM